MVTTQQKNQHLLWRAAFGPPADSLGGLSARQPSEIYASLRAASEAQPAPIDVADSTLQVLRAESEDSFRLMKDDDQLKRVFRLKSREGIKTLNLAWLGQMVNSPQQLREKMAFFWHGHFASRNLNLFYQQGLLDVLRRNALGSFRTLLLDVSRSASMLNFLNAQQNKKDHPNENFAREVMELFTLGRGNYTETDVKEAARAFTGWGATFRGEFTFRRFVHDAGTKTVLGKTGDFDGEAVLDILLEQKATAKFISQKIYRFFVNETVDKKRSDWLADRFYKSGYDIQKLMDEIFTSDWFFDQKNIGAKIKSPVELLAGIRRTLPMEVHNEEAFLVLQRLLGQALFYPPNVAGWPGGRAWIDSSTLMTRMRIPMLLNEQDDLNLRPKADDDVNGGKTEAAAVPQRPGGRQSINTKVEWPRYTKHLDAVPRETLLTAITGSLLQTPMRVPAASLTAFTDDSSREAFIKSATLKVMSLPEYQLC